MEPASQTTVTVTAPRGIVTLSPAGAGLATVPLWNDEPLLSRNGTPITTRTSIQIVAYPAP